MKVKSHLLKLERESFIDKTELVALQSFSGLNCRGGSRHFGVPQTVVEFIKQYDWTSKMWQLGDSTYEGLRQQICMYWSDCAELESEQIKIGYGSMQILERINKIFLSPAAKVLGYAPQFIEYVTEILMCGADYKAVLLDPEKNFKFDANRLIKEISPDYCLLYIDNPNNPTGQLISIIEIEEIVKEALKKNVVVLVDEAYADYVGKENSAVNLIGKYPNVIVTRTFTKGYQFAGIRVGYGILPSELSDYYDKIDIPFCVPAVGSYMAREALLDQKFIASLKEQVKSIKGTLLSGLRKKDFLVSDTHESCPIFLLGHKDQGCDLKKFLLERGILTVTGNDYMNINQNHVRVTVPARAEDFLNRLSE